VKKRSALSRNAYGRSSVYSKSKRKRNDRNDMSGGDKRNEKDGKNGRDENENMSKNESENENESESESETITVIKIVPGAMIEVLIDLLVIVTEKKTGLLHQKNLHPHHHLPWTTRL
jgi:hypothetical protein